MGNRLEKIFQFSIFPTLALAAFPFWSFNSSLGTLISSWLFPIRNFSDSYCTMSDPNHVFMIYSVRFSRQTLSGIWQPRDRLGLPEKLAKDLYISIERRWNQCRQFWNFRSSACQWMTALSALSAAPAAAAAAAINNKISVAIKSMIRNEPHAGYSGTSEAQRVSG